MRTTQPRTDSHAIEPTSDADGDAIPVGLSVEGYRLLKLAARRVLRQWPTYVTRLTATELTNETYLRLNGQRTPWNDESHLLGLAAILMQRTTTDLLRRRTSLKRGSAQMRLQFIDELWVKPSDASKELESPIETELWIAELFDQLAKKHLRGAQIAKMRLAGASFEDIAWELDCSIRTVGREWSHARVWLIRALGA